MRERPDAVFEDYPLTKWYGAGTGNSTITVANSDFAHDPVSKRYGEYFISDPFAPLYATGQLALAVAVKTARNYGSMCACR
jgi:hypothetical protein